MINKILNLFKEYKRLWPLAAVVVLATFLFGDATFMVAVNRLAMIGVILGFFHWVRKALFPTLDLKEFIAKALEDPRASAIIVASILGFLSALCWVTISHADSDSQILARAKPYIPTYKHAVYTYWPDAPCKHHFPGWTEQEAGPKWNARAELKTKREYGVGFSQITIAYKADGSVRFNNFAEAKRRYSALSGWTWDQRFEPKYHFIFMTLEGKRLFASASYYFKDDEDRWAAALVGYNAGLRTVLDRRVICQRTMGCNDSKWFTGLATVKMPGEDKLLYGRPLYERRNEYPHNVIHVRSPKYIKLWEEA